MRRVALLVAITCVPLRAAAQQDSTAISNWFLGDSVLGGAIELATSGQGDSARALVRVRLGSFSHADSLYPQALYTAGLVADHADSALMYFRRVSIEYGQSVWADRALLRLAQLAFAAGEFTAAFRSTQRIIMDYPSSDVRGDAAYWAGRAQLELGNGEEGCRFLAIADRAAAVNVELANRIRYHLQRCVAGTLTADTAPRDTSRAAATTDSRTPKAFTVQIAALESAAAADELMRSLHEQGYEPHVAHTEGLFKVRVGRFAQRSRAQRLARELKRKLGGNPFVVEES